MQSLLQHLQIKQNPDYKVRGDFFVNVHILLVKIISITMLHKYRHNSSGYVLECSRRTGAGGDAEYWTVDQ